MNILSSRRILAVIMLGLAALLLAGNAVAQTVAPGTWHIQVWQQDDGGPYDQNAPFCLDPQPGDPCTLVQDIEVCVDAGAECQTTGADGQVDFSGLAGDTLHEACISDPRFTLVSGSASAAASANPGCVERNVPAGDENTSAMYVELVPVDIEVTSTESVDPVTAGSGANNLTYVVTAKNNGPADATGVEVSAFLTWPAGVTVVSVTPSQGSAPGGWPTTWDIGNLANGASATLTIVLTVSLSAPEGSDLINLTADLNAVDQPDSDDTNDGTEQATSIRWPTATFRVDKEYLTGNGGSVQVTLECDDTTGLLEYDPQTDTTLGSVTVRRFDITGAGTSCTVTEQVPAGYFQYERSADCDVDPVSDQGSYACTITNAEIRATFTVTKDFTDDNPNEVEVTIECNTGLPIEQSKDIDELSDVEFVVVEYDVGELDCEVSEEVPNGYSPTYEAGTGEPGIAGSVESDDEGCQFNEVQTGEFTCHIVNTPDPVDIDITKEWVFEGSSDPQGVSTYYELTLYCDAEILWGSDWCSGGEVPVGPPSETWCKTFSGNGPEEFNAQVIPEYPNSHCYVVEDVADSAVEVDNGCGYLVVSAGEGDSCTIVNTLFFEGIRTLNQYGLALLALLMLGVGLVGFRRFT